MSEKTFCSKCGRQNTTEDKFCSGCGNELSVESNQNTQVNPLEKSMDTTKKSKKQKTGIIPGIILIAIGVIYLLSDIVQRLGIVNSYVETDLSPLVFGIGSCIFGLILIKKRLKKYGWGIGAIFGVSAVIGGIYPLFEKSQLMGGLVIFIICLCFLIKANIKKEGEENA